VKVGQLWPKNQRSMSPPQRISTSTPE
jgi:hypothetical protein